MTLCYRVWVTTTDLPDSLSASGGANARKPQPPGGSWREFRPGDRVVVRRAILPDGMVCPWAVEQQRYALRIKYSDVIGIVTDISDDQLTLRRDAAGYPDSDLVTINPATIVTAKKIPPRPAARRHPDAVS